MNHADIRGQESLGGLDRPSPSCRLAAVIARPPLLSRRRLVVPEDRFEVQKPERLTIAVGTRSQREMAKEALPRADQTAEALPLRLASKLELRRVMHDENVSVSRRTACRLPIVRSENRFRCDLRVPEEPVCALQLGVIQRLWEALAGSVCQAVDQQPEAAGQTNVA